MSYIKNCFKSFSVFNFIMFTASAPGNLFIGGEHSIVYPGHSAIITSVGMRTQCSLEGRRDDKIVVYSEGYGKINESIEDIALRQFNIDDFRHEMNLTRSLIQRYINSFGKFPSGFDMYVETDLPKTCKGLSRSTSFLCSAYKALSLLSNIPIAEDTYHVRILPLQREAHGGAASGVEITSSVFGGFHKVKNDGTRENLGKPEFNVVIGDTRVPARVVLP
jgi:mevalonate kinase